MLNTLVQRQARLEQAGASYTATRSSTTAALNQLFDKPGGSGSLATLVNTFTTSLQTLANNPTSYPNRTAVLSAASDLSQTLNGLSEQVLAMRQSAENAIAQGVNKADGLLQQIDILNKKVIASPTSAALQDQRDALVDQLSGLMDVKVTDQAGGGITISTTGGLQLYDGNTATRLSFDQQTISAASTYSTDPAKRSRRHDHGDRRLGQQARRHRERPDPVGRDRGPDRAARHDAETGDHPARPARGRPRREPLRQGGRRHGRDLGCGERLLDRPRLAPVRQQLHGRGQRTRAAPPAT